MTRAGPLVAVSNVSVGTVALNGRALPGSTPLVLPVRTGANTITFSAIPFMPRTCELQWGPPGLLGTDCTAEGRDNTVKIDGRTMQPGLIIYQTSRLRAPAFRHGDESRDVW